MARVVIATVKGEENIKIAVESLKDSYGSASGVCEEALNRMLFPKPYEITAPTESEIEERTANYTVRLDTNTSFCLGLLSEKAGINKETFISQIVTAFVSDQSIIIGLQAVNTVNEPIKGVYEEQKTEILQEIKQELAVNNDYDKVIITISELMIPEVQAILRKNGFEELRYYTPEKEKQVNQQFTSLLQNEKNRNQAEIQRLQEENQSLKIVNPDIDGLITGTKIVISTLENASENPLKRYKREDILNVFPEKARQILV